MDRFYANEDTYLERIEEDLRKDRFRFEPAKGIAKKRPGKHPRPIVVAPIKNRIVQRAILDVLQGVPEIAASFLSTPTSFGGIKGRAVSDAIEATLNAIKDGNEYYARSDIKEFFRKVPRKEALQKLSPFIQDDGFRELLERATETELANFAALGEDAKWFPTDVGVAQGCSLSNLIGNVLLCKFDAEFNTRGIRCFRFVDDFILLGAKKENVHLAFANAQRALGQLGMDAYDPWSETGKASRGHVKNGFEFLGCHIQDQQVRPSDKAKAKLVGRINNHLATSERSMGNPCKSYQGRTSFVPTLAKLSNIIEGWGKSYKFCNDTKFFSDLDQLIEKRIRSYFNAYNSRRPHVSPGQRAMLRGIHILAEGGTSHVKLDRQELQPALSDANRRQDDSPV